MSSDSEKSGRVARDYEEWVECECCVTRMSDDSDDDNEVIIQSVVPGARTNSLPGLRVVADERFGRN